MKLLKLGVGFSIVGAAGNVAIPILATLMPWLPEAMSLPERAYNAVAHIMSLAVILYHVHMLNGLLQERRELTRTLTDTMSSSSIK